jgi:hypothetical protein
MSLNLVGGQINVVAAERDLYRDDANFLMGSCGQALAVVQGCVPAGRTNPTSNTAEQTRRTTSQACVCAGQAS